MTQGQELDARADRWLDIAAALDRHGVVLVRQAIDQAALAALLALVRAEYGRRDDHPDTLSPEMRNEHARFRSMNLQDPGGPLDALIAPLAVAVATLLLNHYPRVELSAYRCVRPDKENLVLPFHQDSRIVAHLTPGRPPNAPLLNAWIPLESCGGDKPGLQVVNVPLPDIAPNVVREDNFYSSSGLEIDAAWVTEQFGVEALWSPLMQAGDFLLFKGTTIHRTYVTPGMTSERISADLRFV